MYYPTHCIVCFDEQSKWENEIIDTIDRIVRFFRYSRVKNLKIISNELLFYI